MADDIQDDDNPSLKPSGDDAQAPAQPDDTKPAEGRTEPLSGTPEDGVRDDDNEHYRRELEGVTQERDDLAGKLLNLQWQMAETLLKDGPVSAKLYRSLYPDMNGAAFPDGTVDADTLGKVAASIADEYGLKPSPTPRHGNAPSGGLHPGVEHPSASWSSVIPTRNARS